MGYRIDHNFINKDYIIIYSEAYLDNDDIEGAAEYLEKLIEILKTSKKRCFGEKKINISREELIEEIKTGSIKELSVKLGVTENYIYMLKNKLIKGEL